MADDFVSGGTMANNYNDNPEILNEKSIEVINRIK